MHRANVKVKVEEQFSHLPRSTNGKNSGHSPRISYSANVTRIRVLARDEVIELVLVYPRKSGTLLS